MPPIYALGVFQESGGNALHSEKLIKDHEYLNIAIEGYFHPRMGSAGYPLSTDEKSQIDDKKQIVKDLNSKDQKYIIGMFPTIVNDAKDPTFEKANKLNVLVESSITKDNLLGKILGENVTYVDFFNPDASDLYKSGLKNIKSIIEFDGIAINFVNYDNHIAGEISTEEEPKS